MISPLWLAGGGLACLFAGAYLNSKGKIFWSYLLFGISVLLFLSFGHFSFACQEFSSTETPESCEVTVDYTRTTYLFHFSGGKRFEHSLDNDAARLATPEILRGNLPDLKITKTIGHSRTFTTATMIFHSKNDKKGAVEKNE